MDNLITCLNTVGYGLVAAFSFFIIPFSYFYYEEYDDDEEQTIKDRMFGALKYTSFFVVISLLLFLFGLFVKPSQRPPKLDLDWLEKLLMESSKWMNSLFATYWIPIFFSASCLDGEKSISFVIACLFFLGMLVFIVYTVSVVITSETLHPAYQFIHWKAPGLSILPFNMIKGRRKIEAENEDVDTRLAVVRERQRAIQSKYAGSNKLLTERDQRNLENLEDEER